MKITCVQFDPRLGRNAENLSRMESAVAGDGLVLFPEAALSGYGYDSLAEALKFAESVPGPATERLAKACRAKGAHVVVGLLERAGDRLYNSAAVIGPGGLVGVYRKMHLPFLGVDRYATPGDLGFRVFDLPGLKLGVLICYDFSFPEAARVLKLGGAQLVAVPTNWPKMAEVSCDHTPFVRAQENHVHVATCNRVGEEAGFRFIGRSRILKYSGQALAEAGSGEATISAELDVEKADRNRVVNVPGKYELDRIGHRRPEHYGAISSTTTG